MNFHDDSRGGGEGKEPKVALKGSFLKFNLTNRRFIKVEKSSKNVYEVVLVKSCKIAKSSNAHADTILEYFNESNEFQLVFRYTLKRA